MNIEKVKSELKMKNLYFPECKVTRGSHTISEELEINIERHIEKKGDTEYDVYVSVNINKEGNDLAVFVTAKATFSIENSDAELVENLIKTNTVAIMFPFIRSQVSLLTTQPGLTPIVLPPINTAKLNSIMK